MATEVIERTYHQCNDNTVEVRTFHHTGYLIRYKQLIRVGGKLVWKMGIYRSGCKNRFGAIREFVRDRRAWQGDLWCGQILDTRRSGWCDVDYIDAGCFEEVRSRD